MLLMYTYVLLPTMAHELGTEHRSHRCLTHGVCHAHILSSLWLVCQHWVRTEQSSVNILWLLAHLALGCSLHATLSHKGLKSLKFMPCATKRFADRS